ncbi:MAG: aminotransferase class I/II-fold pyridoxal phosphate-dependent enzyme [Lachnospiraceae bacterium]|nr:aminotransferase class I/II-fold pyridoxal phosphate-dependent enzyme [Lachnospiraceae bacterium]
MDFEAMEAACDENVKSFVLSNPHNPSGRVFSREELTELQDFCSRHDLLMISDEIHCDLVFEGKHVPWFSVNEEAREHSVTLTSASKTYNIPAIPYAFAIIPNAELRQKYLDICYGLFSPVGVLGIEALRAAYGQCGEWHRELIAYLRANRDYMEERIRSIPGISVNHNEATYLAFADCRELGLEDPWTFFREKAGVNFNDGRDFDAPGYVRINFACPRSQLKEALDRVETAVRELI